MFKMILIVALATGEAVGPLRVRESFPSFDACTERLPAETKLAHERAGKAWPGQPFVVFMSCQPDKEPGQPT